MPAKFDLVFDILQHLPLAGTQRNPVQDEWVLHVFGRENKPSSLEQTDQQVTRRQMSNLAEIGLCQSSFRPNNIAIFARIARSFGPNLQKSGVFRLASGSQAARPRARRLDDRSGRNRSPIDWRSAMAVGFVAEVPTRVCLGQPLRRALSLTPRPRPSVTAEAQWSEFRLNAAALMTVKRAVAIQRGAALTLCEDGARLADGFVGRENRFRQFRLLQTG